MSLETEVSILTASVEQLVDVYQEKATEINSAVSQALEYPSLLRVVYIDALNGSDDFDGLTIATAKKSFSGANSIVPNTLSGTYYLLSDMKMEHLGFLDRSLRFIGWDPSGVEVERKLSVADTGDNNWPNFYSYSASRTIEFRSIHFEIPADTVYPETASSDRLMFKVTGVTNMQMDNCRISNPTDAALTKVFKFWTLVADIRSLTLESDAPGSVFYGVSAGASPDDRQGISTNLTSA